MDFKAALKSGCICLNLQSDTKDGVIEEMLDLMVQAGKLLDIDVLDHLIIGSSGRFVSLKERGLGFS